MQEILSKKKIGVRVKNLRLDNKFSQSYVSEKLKISRSNYSQIELGNQFPSFHTLYLISNLYGKSYEWLLHGDATQSKDSDGEPLIKSRVNEMQRTLSTFKRVLTEFEEEFKKMTLTTIPQENAMSWNHKNER